MLKSMTAYGRACLVSPLGRFTAEIHSVNKKYLEINATLPKEFLRFDAEIKKWIAPVVTRGQITVKIGVSFDKTTPFKVKPNLPLARQLKSAWEAMAEDLNLPPERGFKIEMLANEPDIILFDENLQQEEKVRDAIHNLLNMALEKLIEMKKAEGEALHKDINQRLGRMKGWIEKIALKAPESTKRYRQKLTDKIEEVMERRIENEERILREVCIYAERIDVTEEIIRFESHLKQFGELLNGPEESIGKTLEFLLQELNREINTIGAKSSEVEVSHLVVEIKSELEKIREQIQNIE